MDKLCMEIKIKSKQMKKKKLKCNIEKSLFGNTKMEYLVFWVTHGVKPIDKKLQALKNMKPPIFENKYVGL